MGKARIEYLDGLRGIAIGGVVLFHAFHYVYFNSLISRYGGMGVNLFFVISGFVILMTLEKCRDFADFFKRRLMRLYPAMLIACPLTMTLLVFLGWPDGASLLPGLTFIDDRWWSWLLGRPVHPIDGVYWTLYFEMRFYVIFGVSYFLFGERKAIGILVAMNVFYLILLELGHGMGVWSMTDFRFEAWFAAGALFYVWVRDQREVVYWLAIAVGAVAAWTTYPSHGPRTVGAAIIILFALAVRSGVAASALTFRPLVWLGMISYPLYLTHARILETLGPWVGIPAALAVAHYIATQLEPVVSAWLKAPRSYFPISLRPAGKG